MKFMARIQILEYYPEKFAYVFSVQVYYISHGERSICSIPPSTSFSPPILPGPNQTANDPHSRQTAEERCGGVVQAASAVHGRPQISGMCCD